MTTPSRSKQLLIWVVAALLATATLTVILLSERRPTAGRHALFFTGDPQRGRTLFFGDKQCGICHSIGREGGHIAPDLSQTRPRSPAMGWLATALWNHAPGMFRSIRGSTAYPQLDSQEMADILAFLYQAAGADPPGNPAAGQKIFEQKGCSHCHSAGSVGGKSAPELSGLAAAGANEWTRAMWNHAQSMVGPVTTALGKWPQFMGTDMNDLIAYVSGGSPAQPEKTVGDVEHGWKVFQARCIQCHSVGGNGGKIGPELGPERELPLTTTRFASLLWNHAPAMLALSQEKGIAPPTLDGAEMADLAAFLASLRYFEPTGSALVGERVFNDRGCGRCHGPSAQGTPLGPRLQTKGEAYTAVSFTTALWKHGPKMVDRRGQAGIPWPILAPTDVGDLVSFLNAQH
jgi:cytochrome c2